MTPRPHGLKPIGPPGLGIYADPAGDLHFDVPEFLRFAGWPNTQEARDRASQIFADVCSKAFPGVPVVDA